MIQPPTDNLYKFLAIFGLVIIVTSAWGVYQTQFAYLSAINEARSRMDAQLQRYKDLENQHLSLLLRAADAKDSAESERLGSESKELHARAQDLFKSVQPESAKHCKSAAAFVILLSIPIKAHIGMESA